MRPSTAARSALLILALWALPAIARAAQDETDAESSDWVRATDLYHTGPDSYPSLENRDLGDPWTVDGERVIWNSALPFFAQDVIDQGFELPNPYGVAFVGYWQKQDLVLEEFSLGIGGGPSQPIDFIDFGTPTAENAAILLKLDAWLFPFMNACT